MSLAHSAIAATLWAQSGASLVIRLDGFASALNPLPYPQSPVCLFA
jgi:hypothetical protein